MSKRFIDTGFLDQKWIRKLTPDRKIFLIYLMLKCDNGGIIELDLEDASFWIGKKIDSVNFLPEGYLIFLEKSGKYFMPKFIEWQYPNFPHSKVHQQMQAKEILINNGIYDAEKQCIVLPNNCLNIGENLGKVCVHGNGNGIVNGNDTGKKGSGEKKKFIPPTLDQVKEYFKENGYSEEGAIKAFSHYDLADWHDTEGKPVLSWKQKIHTNWFKPEHKIKVHEDPIERGMRELEAVRARQKS
jgi:hypothetical protein